MPYAIVVCGGKQVRVSEGDKVPVEKLTAAPGTTVELDKVLAYHDGKQVKFGRPHLAGCKVVGEVVTQGRGKKLMVFKDMMRKGIRKHQGHRQSYTELRITKIVAN